MSSTNPCLSCGACCAYYRASFYWAEAEKTLGGAVPPELTEKLDAFRRVMKGTNQKNPRCVALEGIIGERVRCAIYELRSTVCREFEVSWENGKRNERCDKARIAWGLSPLEPPALPGDTPDAPGPSSPSNPDDPMRNLQRAA
ncbi:MAG: YkgJ family cysteine cluster protein [Chloroflexi bacterium]|nr:YkgJ family cysteine cluster protein [Chloroflexota bacterium]